MISLTCSYADHTHDYPDDWNFGGPDKFDPRADLRWRSSTYVYYGRALDPLVHTQVPLCDDQAIDEFTLLCRITDLDPVYLAVIRPGEPKPVILSEYDRASDTAYDREPAG